MEWFISLLVFLNFSIVFKIETSFCSNVLLNELAIYVNLRKIVKLKINKIEIS